MRILHVVPTYFPAVRYGGPIYSVHSLCRALAARGHDVHVHTTNIDGSGVSNVSLTEAFAVDGVTVRYFPCKWGRRLYRSPEMGRALAAHVTEFDVLHLHSVFLWPTLAAARAARRRNVPYLLAPRGMLVGDLVARKSRFLKTAWIKLFERTNVANAAAIHVTSELERQELAKFEFPMRRVVVVPNGVEPRASALTEQFPDCALKRHVLYLGRVNWKKGIDRLIAAMAYVPNANLLIAGNDEEGYQPYLETMARDLGLSDRVRFLGPVYNDAKWSLLRSATLFVSPSHSENFGIAALEAMACGCPVVVTPEVGLAEVIGGAGAGLIVDGEPRQLGAAVTALLADPERCRIMGEAGKRLAALDFSWPRIAERMEEIYQQCIEDCDSRA